MEQPLGGARIGILTVSDTCSKGEAADLSGPNLAAVLTTSQGLSVAKGDGAIVSDCVADDVEAIQEVLKRWCDQLELCMVLTTGGTGFSSRDVTPEATRPLLDKEAAGMATTMLVGSLSITPLAMLSRGLCGVRKKTLIINLPGSKKASQECLQFLLPALPHAMDLLSDNRDQVKAVHGSIGGCRHHHGDAKPSRVGRVSERARHSPYPMVPLQDALAIVHAQASTRPLVTISDLLGCVGRVLGEDVVAAIALPPFPASVKDGYAVIAGDGAGERSVLTSVLAGHRGCVVEVEPGTVCRVSTGAPLPAGADAVVQVEDTQLIKSTPDGSEEEVVRILVSVKPGHDVRPVGSDIPLGQLILSKGDVLGPPEIGLLAAVGVTSVQAVELPRVAVLSTGNELADPTQGVLSEGQVYDSNRSTLLAVLKEQGFPTLDLGIAADSREVLRSKLRQAFEQSDVLVTSGGVSMGEMDLLKPVLKEDFKANLHFGRVFLKPGKPTTFATVEWSGSRKLIFALPALRKMAGRTDFELTKISVKTSFSVVLDTRPEYQRVCVQWGAGEMVPMATSTGSQCSSRLLSMKAANALLVLPPSTDTLSQLPAGTTLPALLVPKSL